MHALVLASDGNANSFGAARYPIGLIDGPAAAPTLADSTRVTNAHSRPLRKVIQRAALRR